LKVRGTDNTLVDFHMLNGENNRLDTQGLASPQFDKQNYSLTLGQKITEQHGILFSANYLESIVSDISLGETKNKERSNINLLTKYSYRDGWLDQLDVSFIYAPYEEKDFLRDVLNSDYTTDGGAYGTALKINHALKYGELDFSLSGNLSEKSRQAPPHYYSWIQARGREWGQEANQSQGSVLLSQEGGTGNLENTQTSLTSKTKFSFNEFHWAGSTHHFQMGAQVDYEEIQRLRQIDHFEYSNAVQYSTALGTQPLNCSGYTTDCVELTLISPIEELEARLGGEIDFTNPEHIEAYSDNILITPQYFRTRLVNPQEDIQVDLMRYSLFASNDITIDALSVYLGLRADYDNIFENLNLAPRFSLSYDIFGDRSAAAIVGLNRYYDVGLLADRINEQKIPTFLQYRTIRDGFLQSWLDSSFVTDFRYRFVDVDTPYDDELLIAWKQSLNTWGTWAIKYVYREKNDQLATNEEPIREADGYSYLQLNNLGYGESERFSLSWNGRFYEHNFWFNLSHQTNTSNVNDYTNSIDGTRRDDLVYYEGQEISRAELNVIKSNFGRPFTASFGWSRTWFEQLTLVASGNYSSAYKTAVNTGSFTLSNILIQTCDTCQANYLIVPVYREEKKESRVFINLGVNWDYSISPRQKLSLDLDILNLFNRRTYTVNNGQSGIEPGRQLWLGLSYQYQ
ncbi:MAG: porin, partial [Pseudomonadota bacterium]